MKNISSPIRRIFDLEFYVKLRLQLDRSIGDKLYNQHRGFFESELYLQFYEQLEEGLDLILRNKSNDI